MGRERSFRSYADPRLKGNCLEEKARLAAECKLLLLL